MHVVIIVLFKILTTKVSERPSKLAKNRDAIYIFHTIQKVNDDRNKSNLMVLATAVNVVASAPSVLAVKGEGGRGQERDHGNDRDHFGQEKDHGSDRG